MTAGDIRSRGESRLTDIRRDLDGLETSTPQDASALLRAVAALQLGLANVASQVSVLMNVHPALAARESCEAIQREGTTLSMSVAQSRPIYEALSKVDTATMDDPARRMVELTLQDMRRAGAHLDDQARERAQQLRLHITELAQAYGRNLRDDVRTVELPAAALEGTPADYRAAHPADSRGVVKVTTDPPDMAPLQTYSKDAPARHALAKANYDRARGNIEIFDQLRRARHDLAQQLGYPDFAAYNLQDKMMASPERL